MYNNIVKNIIKRRSIEKHRRSVKKKASPKKVRLVKKKASPKKVRSVKKKASPKKVRSVKKKSSPKKVRSVKKKASPKKVRSVKKKSSLKKVRSFKKKKASPKKVTFKGQFGGDDDDECERIMKKLSYHETLEVCAGNNIVNYENLNRIFGADKIDKCYKKPTFNIDCSNYDKMYNEYKNNKNKGTDGPGPVSP